MPLTIARLLRRAGPMLLALLCVTGLVRSSAATQRAGALPDLPPPLVIMTRPQSQRELVAALRLGGYVIFVRHAETDISQTDSDIQHLENCHTQRNLSARGRSDAERIGRDIRALKIPIGQVLASPYCRTLDTARLAFGQATPTRELISRNVTSNAAKRQQLIEDMKQLLATPPAPGLNTVLVSHNFNLQDATMIALEEGETAIFQPLDSGGFKLVAQIRAHQWEALRSSEAAVR